MSNFFAAAGLAASIVVLAATPAHAQQQQCPPGLQPSGPYCETSGPVRNCPPGAQPSGVYCETRPNQGGNNNQGGQGGVAGFTATEAQVRKLKQDSADDLFDKVNRLLAAARLPRLRFHQLVITNTNTGFVASITGLSLRASTLLRKAGLPVAVVGCVVSSCPLGYNTRIDLRRDTFSAAATARRLYLPHRSLALRGGQTREVVVKVPRTKAMRQRLAGARALTVRVVTRVRTSNLQLLNRTVKTITIRLR